MANACDSDAYTSTESPPRRSQLPVELLHIIASHVVVDYLDDLIAGPLSLPSPDFETLRNDMERLQAAPSHAQNVGEDIGGDDDAQADLPHIGLDGHDDLAEGAENADVVDGDDDVAGHDAEADIFGLYSDKTLEQYNPVIPLTQSSTQLRAVTLGVLSDLLGIQLVKERVWRLSKKPWRFIQLTRYAWANPAYLHHFRRHFNFHTVAISSSVIISYTTIAYDSYRLQLARDAITNVADLAMYQRSKHLVDKLLNSSTMSMNITKLINNEVARVKVTCERARVLAREMAEFIIFEVHMIVWRRVFGIVCTVEEMTQECDKWTGLEDSIVRSDDPNGVISVSAQILEISLYYLYFLLMECAWR
ncbi:hypothetical protein BDY19DRAFT_974043 [Irpex rosettiformis]|uniref:Uncharacterized protein n=1 Tax=Irpex rosettiformis TaxID=378272 RepID=A0ACB8TQ47_9APHY|nr:hypothetical protein BDY19DRAFT_974043 [Irpex rosettiformis]